MINDFLSHPFFGIFHMERRCTPTTHHVYDRTWIGCMLIAAISFGRCQ